MFNDPLAIKKFEELNNNYNFNSIFETGTSQGHGTVWCSRFKDDVFTVESDKGKFDGLKDIVNKHGFNLILNGLFESIEFNIYQNGNKKIYSFWGNAEEVLKIVLKYIKTKRPILFYIDAHSINGELQAISKNELNDSIIIIHDFYNPEHPEFGHNNYKLEDIKEELFKINPNYKTFYNEEAYKPPTPGRGILYAV